MPGEGACEGPQGRWLDLKMQLCDLEELGFPLRAARPPLLIGEEHNQVSLRKITLAARYRESYERN